MAFYDIFEKGRKEKRIARFSVLFKVCKNLPEESFREFHLIYINIKIKIDCMETKTIYNMHPGVKYAHLERIDIPGIVKAEKEKWSNRTLTKVNESVVRLGIVEGEFHWHKHDNDDEFFFVLEGQLLIDLEDRTIELNPQQGVTITKGVMHRPRAPQRTVMLMVETNAIVPTGD